MTSSTSSQRHVIGELVREINQALGRFIQAESDYLEHIGSELSPVADALSAFTLDSGKRLRPLFAYVGYLSTGSHADSHYLTAATSLELVHVCALIHDDVMDASDTRRGKPAIHRHFEEFHHNHGLVGNSQQFGLSSAILIGDLALVIASKMLHESGISNEAKLRSMPIYDEMRIELMAGQFLDVFEQTLHSHDIDRSMKIARFKSGKYSIERPLHFGAALGSANPDRYFETFSAYGLPLGEAFQLRDDIMGVFGEPAQTGKPAGDDLREGKHTALIAVTLEKSSHAQRVTVESLLGDPRLTPDHIDTMREIIVETGGLREIETMIARLTEQATAALSDPALDPTARSILEELAVLATQRSN